MDGPTLVGRTIGGRYAIDALVGEGAMGAVYRATQIVLGTTVAVKVLHRPLHADPTFTARFLEEARAASRINHAGSVRVLDFGEDPDGLLYIVMEYLDGRPLDQVLAAEGPLPSTRIVDIASQILAALAVAHEMGIIHRDLKPENIMLLAGTSDEGKPCDVVKVCDFGVAKQIEPLAGRARATGDGIVIGTPAYMSPEQARGDVLDPTSDLYAVGVLIFQLMTGKLPFDGATPMGTALMHVTEEPTRPCLLNPSADERLEAICLKAMRKRSSDRPASAREMRAELRALLADDASPEPLPSLMEQVRPRARRGGMVVAGSLLLATTLAGIVAYGRQKASVAEASELANVPSAPAVAPRPAASPAVSVAMANTATAPDRGAAPTTSTSSPAASHGSNGHAAEPAVDPEAELRDEAPAKPAVASSAAAEPAQRRSAQRRGVARGHARRHDKASPPAASPSPASSSSPASPSLQELPRPALPSPDESPRAAAPPPAELSKSPDAAPKEAPVNAKTREPSAEPDPLPLPVFPDPPPPEADPFDAPR